MDPNLEAARMEEFRPPKQERATAKGMVQLNMPYTRSAKVCDGEDKKYKTV